MGLRLRKIIKLRPGVKLNLSKSGGSFSFGGKGFTVNLGRKGTRSTIGIPGTGISYSTYDKRKGARKIFYWLWAFVLIGGALAAYYWRT